MLCSRASGEAPGAMQTRHRGRARASRVCQQQEAGSKRCSQRRFSRRSRQKSWARQCHRASHEVAQHSAVTPQAFAPLPEGQQSSM